MKGTMQEDNLLTEDDVVRYTVTWLERCGFRMVKPPCFGRSKGDDVSAVNDNGVEIYVECKGAISKSGNKLHDWQNAAMAIFGAIVETEFRRPSKRLAIAVPETASYRTMLDPSRNFLARKSITLLWVRQGGEIIVDGAPNNSLQA